MAISMVNASNFDDGQDADGSEVVAEIQNIIDNALNLVAPWTGDMNAGGNRLTGLSFGTAASNTIQVFGNPRTGLYFPNSNTVNLVANGTSRVQADTNLRLQVDNGVGVNRAPFSFCFEVQGGIFSTDAGAGGNPQAIFRAHPSIDIVEVGSLTAHAMVLTTNSAERARVDEAGRFMVGTTVQTGSVASDIVMKNNNAVHFIKADGSGSGNYSVASDAFDNINLNVPSVSDSINFNFNGTIFGWVQCNSDGSGMGIMFASASTDHPAPAATTCIIYQRITGGKGELCCRFPSGDVQVMATEP